MGSLGSVGKSWGHRLLLILGVTSEEGEWGNGSAFGVSVLLWGDDMGSVYTHFDLVGGRGMG